MSQYHNISKVRISQLFLAGNPPQMFSSQLLHYDSSTFCALLGGRSLTKSWKARRRWRKRAKRATKRALRMRLRTPCFCFAKEKPTLRFPATSFKPWLTFCQNHPHVCSISDECNAVRLVVMTALTVKNYFAFKNVAMQLCHFPIINIQNLPIFGFYDYIVASKCHT